MSWDDYQNAITEWVAKGSGLLVPGQVAWTQQDARKPPNPTILLRISNIAEIGQSELTFEENPHTFAPLTVAAVDTAGNRVNVPAHERLTGDGPVLVESSTDDPPAPLTEGQLVWLVAPDADHLQFAESYEATGGGDVGNPITVIDIQDAGTGTLTISPTADTLRAGEELVAASRVMCRVSVELRCSSGPDGPGQGENIATSVLQRVRTRRELPSQREILSNANIALIEVERVRAILGIKDAVRFEPRSYLNVYFCVPLTETEFLQIIESVEATNLSTGQTFTIRRG